MALLIFAVILASLALTELTTGYRRYLRRRAVDPDTSPRSEPVAAERDVEREEIRLARALAGGALSPAAYRFALADLAARDTTRHPLVVPDDHGDRF